MKDRRIFLRALLSLAVKYKDAENTEIDAFTSTIGAGGLFIETFHPLPVDRDVSIELHLPGSAGKTTFKGQVVWSRIEYSENQPPGMGIKFIRISRQDQAKINELITRILVGGTEEGY